MTLTQDTLDVDDAMLPITGGFFKLWRRRVEAGETGGKDTASDERQIRLKSLSA